VLEALKSSIAGELFEAAEYDDGRGFHSSTSQFNLSRLSPKFHQTTQRNPQKVIASS
jgi:hypothetical protein